MMTVNKSVYIHAYTYVLVSGWVRVTSEQMSIYDEFSKQTYHRFSKLNLFFFLYLDRIRHKWWLKEEKRDILCIDTIGYEGEKES